MNKKLTDKLRVFASGILAGVALSMIAIYFAGGVAVDGHDLVFMGHTQTPAVVTAITSSSIQPPDIKWESYKWADGSGISWEAKFGQVILNSSGEFTVQHKDGTFTMYDTDGKECGFGGDINFQSVR